MTEQKAKETKAKLEVAGIFAGVALGAMASIGADRVTRIGLNMIPLAGASKLTKLLAPIGIIGAGAAVGTLAGQGMEKKIERVTKVGCWVTDKLAKKEAKEGKEKELDELEKRKEIEKEIKETREELEKQLKELDTSDERSAKIISNLTDSLNELEKMYDEKVKELDDEKVDAVKEMNKKLDDNLVVLKDQLKKEH